MLSSTQPALGELLVLEETSRKSGVEGKDGECATGAGDSESFAAVSRAAGEQNSGERELSAPTRTVPGGNTEKNRSAQRSVLDVP